MILTIVLVLVDRIIKLIMLENKVNITVIPKILNLTYVENRGMVFGLAQGSSYIMGAVSLVICLAIAIYIVKTWHKDDFSPAWYFILAGGIGNTIDRFIWGYVVDFIDTPWIPTFNLADIFIVLGILALIIQVLLNSGNKHKARNKMGDRYNW